MRPPPPNFRSPHPLEDAAAWRQFERTALLAALDRCWRDFIRDARNLREATAVRRGFSGVAINPSLSSRKIGTSQQVSCLVFYRAFSGRTPTEEFQVELRLTYTALLADFRSTALTTLFRGPVLHTGGA